MTEANQETTGLAVTSSSAAPMATLAAEVVPALSIRNDQTRFDAAQFSALKHMGLGSVGQADLDMFFLQCKRTGLDPFARQIYLIPRKGKYSIQTSVDGFRLIATRTGVYAGSKESWQFSQDGAVISATVKVYRIVAGRKCGFEATAHYVEYVQECFDKNGKFGPNDAWSKYPARMLSKCAESLALRKAFPQELSGLYSTDEMPEEEQQQQTPHDTSLKQVQHVEVEKAQVVQEDSSRVDTDFVLYVQNASVEELRKKYPTLEKDKKKYVYDEMKLRGKLKSQT